jgi:predicted dehydrogenase
MRKKKTVRAGLVGSGFAASFHFEALRKVCAADVDVVGVYSLDKEGSAAFARKRGIRVFDSLEALIDEVDVVHVCTQPNSHEPISVAALERDRFVVCEKSLTGYFGDGNEEFDGEKASKKTALDEALAAVDRILEAENRSKGRLLYAENWVYAPAVQKEREILEKTGGQVLWLMGEESHHGSHSPAAGRWSTYGGGALVGMGCHPLTVALYFKRIEGRTRHNQPILPKTVSARCHGITRLDGFADEGHIRTGYYDIDDLAAIHVEFEDGAVADIFASFVVLGGIRNWIRVSANNHMTICNINPNTAMQTYNPVESNFDDIYVVEKIGTKQGWACTSPDEDWLTGYPQEMEAFYRTIVDGEPLECDSVLAANAISTLYSAYLSVERQGAVTNIRTY